jgi:thiol-disulfide isomerase/thioredoxin
MPFAQSSEIYPAIVQGARMAGNDALAREVESRRPPRLFDLYQRWQKSNPPPKPGDSPDVRRAHAKALLDQAAKWIAHSPDELIGHAERLRALVELDAPAGELERTGERLMELDRRRSAGGLSYFPSVARAYIQRGVRLDRVPAILVEAIESYDDPDSVRQIDLEPMEEYIAQTRTLLVSRHVDSVVLLTELYEKQGRLEQAHEALRVLEQYLKSNKPPADSRYSNALQNYRIACHSFWQRVANLAEREGRKLDALHAYHEAWALFPGTKDPLLEPQRRLWKELGGTDESWTRWIAPPAEVRTSPAGTPPDAFHKVNRSLPEFRVKDLNGADWTRDRFKDKTVIAVVWTTWCLPCREELPYLERLAVKLKDRPDVLVVSLNADYNIGEVGPYVKQAGYTVPVLLARQLAEDLMPEFSIPRTFIIRNNVIVAEQTGFGPEKQKWIDRVIAEVR